MLLYNNKSLLITIMLGTNKEHILYDTNVLTAVVVVDDDNSVDDDDDDDDEKE